MPQNNQDLSPISNCPPGQRSGIILRQLVATGLGVSPFAPCGCWDDLLYGFAAGRSIIAGALKSKIGKALTLGVGEELFANTLLKNRLGKLAVKKREASELLNGLESSKRTLENQTGAVRATMNLIRRDIAKKRADLAELLDTINRALQEGIDVLTNDIAQVNKRLEALGSKLKPVIDEFPPSTPGYLDKRRASLPDYDSLVDKYRAGKKEIDDFKVDIQTKKEQIKDSTKGFSETTKLDIEKIEDEIKADLENLEINQKILDHPRPPIEVEPLVFGEVPGPGPTRTIPAGKMEDQILDLAQVLDQEKDHLDLITNLQDTSRVNTRAKAVERSAAIDSFFSDIASSMVAVILDILSTFTLVGPHLCREGTDGVTLNLENCKCDICPPDKQLCEPISFDPGLRLPWTVVADSANYCLDPCCDGQVDELGQYLRVYKPSSYIFNGGIAELLGIPPCVCACPGDLVKQPCVNSVCGDNFICTSAFFPDHTCFSSLELFFFDPVLLTKFDWNDGSNGKDCGYRCKNEISDADCFASYGQYTKWSTRTDLQYCSCVCQDKSETDCPEKATYTKIDNHNLPEDSQLSYCDILENPISPVCSCVCDRPDDCPEGQVLNRLVFGDNACECVPEVTTTVPPVEEEGSPSITDGYENYGQSEKTYSFNTETQKWEITFTNNSFKIQS